MDISFLFDQELYRNESAKTFVLTILQRAIQRGILSGGTRLKQGLIASQLGVSHIPVREALRQLESEGLVTLLPHRGAKVATLSPAEARDIFNIRLFLELGALKLSFPHLTTIDLMRARKNLETADQEDDVGQWSELNWDFHYMLYAPSQNPKLIKLIEEMHHNVNRYLRIYISLMNFQDRSQKEHYELLHACETKNLPQALEVLEKHLLQASHHLAHFLENQKTPREET